MRIQKQSIRPNLFIWVPIFLISCTNVSAVPSHLIGVWKTSDSRFSECRIEFTEDSVVLGLANGEQQYNSIKEVQSVEERGRRVSYSISYLDSEGRESKLTFMYDADSGGTIQLKHHREIWKKSNN